MKKFKFFVLSLAFLSASGCSLQKETVASEKPQSVKSQVVKASAANAVTPKFEVLATFTTEFQETGDGRLNNIKLASLAIDRKRLNPGEEFSFNKTVGSTTPDRGYQKATIFLDGEKVKDYGGGICQVSSTLYNAALNAGLEITERHPHSMKVYYVEEGKDAATNIGSKDLKFKNNLGFPIEINTYTGEGTFTAEILKVII